MIIKYYVAPVLENYLVIKLSPDIINGIWIYRLERDNCLDSDYKTAVPVYNPLGLLSGVKNRKSRKLLSDILKSVKSNELEFFCIEKADSNVFVSLTELAEQFGNNVPISDKTPEFEAKLEKNTFEKSELFIGISPEY